MTRKMIIKDDLVATNADADADAELIGRGILLSNGPTFGEWLMK